MNPYDILGVNENATDEEIKKAYRTLSRKYHPDANINNPNKAEAEEKFKEVQRAYKEIMDMRQGKTFNGYNGQGFYDEGEDEEAMRRNAARNYIANGYYQEALNVLAELKIKNGQWYALGALANRGLGNISNARIYINKALELEPNNYEFMAYKSQIEGNMGFYGNMQDQMGDFVYTDNGMCSSLCLGSLCCNLFCPGSFVFCC